jgi:hypothetical protein
MTGTGNALKALKPSVVNVGQVYDSIFSHFLSETFSITVYAPLREIEFLDHEP